MYKFYPTKKLIGKTEDFLYEETISYEFSKRYRRREEVDRFYKIITDNLKQFDMQNDLRKFFNSEYFKKNYAKESKKFMQSKRGEELHKNIMHTLNINIKKYYPILHKGEVKIFLYPTYIKGQTFELKKYDMNIERPFPIKLYEETVVYCDGVYDLFHYGHVRLFEQAKNIYPHIFVVAGVSSDEDNLKYKGQSVFNEDQRAESVQLCRYVDRVIKKCPWKLTADFLIEHEIDYVIHDDEPYPMEGHDDIYKDIKEMGMFIPSMRTLGISTSDIITQLLKKYNIFLIRNLKRGIHPRQMNISQLKAKFIIFEDKIKRTIVQKVVNEYREFKRELRDTANYWFTLVFGVKN